MRVVAHAIVERYDDPSLKNELKELYQKIGLLDLIPGRRVVIKPNFVLSRHPANRDIYSIITHPSLVRATYEIVTEAKASFCIIADSPQYNCDFQELRTVLGLRGLPVLDLRPYYCVGFHWLSNKIPQPGDPKGAVEIDWQKNSLLNAKDPNKFYGSCCIRKELKENYAKYMISRTIWDSDILINMPKLKTHKKVGATLGAKNLVGTLVDKNRFPHFSIGSKENGGDQFPPNTFSSYEQFLLGVERWSYDHLLSKGYEDLHKFLYEKVFKIQQLKSKKILDVGNWYGNDTCWRATADLTNIFDHRYRGKVFTLIDGIIGGELDGPLSPHSIIRNTLIASNDIMLGDLAAVRFMGFNVGRIPLYKYFYSQRKKDFDKLELIPSLNFTPFKPHPGWKGHI